MASLGVGAAVLRILESPAVAQQSQDVQILQTAASLEVLAISAYEAALRLPFLQSAPDTRTGMGLVKLFAGTTSAQHVEHARALNQAIKQLGGQEQTSANPVLGDVVNRARPGLTGPLPLIDLALEIEQTATENYVAALANLNDANARTVVASIVGVESQHAAMLRTTKALLSANALDLVTVEPPVDVSRLPDAIGNVGYPDTFMGTGKARANEEGAVR